jgi:hypothetical protein
MMEFDFVKFTNSAVKFRPHRKGTVVVLAALAFAEWAE